MLLPLLLLLSAAAHTTQGYGSGAPDRACGDLKPQHGSWNRPQRGRAPYSIRAEGELKPGEQLQVTIVGSGDEEFEGFMVAARAADDQYGRGEKLGRWSAGYSTKVVCDGQALTHSHKGDRSQITATWTAPDNLDKAVYFTASIVGEFTEYWLNVKSQEVPLYTAMEPSPAPQNGTLASLCGPDALKPLDLDDDDWPNVAILCQNDDHCPCGWRCCPDCSWSNNNNSTCAGHAICRQVAEGFHNTHDSVEHFYRSSEDDDIYGK